MKLVFYFLNYLDEDVACDTEHKGNIKDAKAFYSERVMERVTR